MDGADDYQEPETKADYALTIATQPIELAPNRIVSVTTYNGQFPGPLLRFKEGVRVTVDVHNDTDMPEQLHWHGQAIPFGCGWRCRGGNALHPAPRQPADFVRAPTLGVALLSHARACRSRSEPRAVQRPGRSGLHRAEARPGQI